jgi:serine/threonine protein kinase
MYEQAGDHERALQILDRGRFFEEAARVSETLGQLEKAAQLYIQADNPAKAAEAYEKAGDRIKAANILGELAIKTGNIPEAAAHFQEGEDYLRAAELFESVDMLTEAAGAFEAAGSHAAAGGVYLRAGSKDRAAAAYEQGGEYEASAKLYEQCGDAAKSAELFAKAGLTFKGGETAAKAGQTDKAIALLQRVPQGDESYGAATELLGRLFIEANRPGLAVERLQRSLEGQQMGPENLAAHYWLAAGLEKSGQIDRATVLYKQILAEDFQYKDVQARLTRLQTSPSAAPVAPDPAAAGAAVHATPQHPLPAVAKELSGRIGKYEIVKPLGRGAMGMVYVARDPVLERDVAVKVMVAGIADDPNARQRFEREAKAVARMMHQNVVTVHDMGYHADGSPYIAMELLRGRDLLRAMREPPPMERARKLDIILEVLVGLAHAHGSGIVHRDIKPANIFLTSDGVVKIMDFGVARLTAGSMTETGNVIGTADYMSPEQVRGDKVDGRSDLFSVGCVLYEMLTGRRPFQSETLMTIFYKITHDQPDWTAIPAGEGAEELRGVLEKALAKDFEARFQTADEFALALRECQHDRPVSEARPRADEPADEEPPAPQTSAVQPAPSDIVVVHEDSIGVAPAQPSEPAPPPAVKPAAAAAPRAPAGPPVAQVPPPPAAQPAQVPRFASQEEIGRGPVGTVLRATDRKSGNIVALRMLPPELVEESGGRQALLADLKAASQVIHPNVARVLGMVNVDGQLCIMSEYVSGWNCAGPLRAGRRMGLAQTLSVARALAAALSAVHARRLVHGSIQPSNVMLASGSVKLIDLGLGRLAGRRPVPEGYGGPGIERDVAGDLYALVALFYHLYTGSPPTGPQVAPPSQRIGGTPPAFDQILLRGLSPRPEQRFPSAGQLAGELGKIG